MVLNPPRSGLLFPDLGGCRQRGPSDRPECYKFICWHQHSFVDSLISLTEESSMEIFRGQRAVLWGDTGGLIPGTERAAGGAVGGLASLSFQYHILVQLPLRYEPSFSDHQRCRIHVAPPSPHYRICVYSPHAPMPLVDTVLLSPWASWIGWWIWKCLGRSFWPLSVTSGGDNIPPKRAAQQRQQPKNQAICAAAQWTSVMSTLPLAG